MGFGQEKVMRLQSLINDVSQILFIGSSFDKKKLIILTSQQIVFINIWPLIRLFDFSQSPMDSFTTI